MISSFFYEEKQMSRSIIAEYIMQEYKLKQAYSKKKRENCKEKNCKECKYLEICSENLCLNLKSIIQNGL